MSDKRRRARVQGGWAGSNKPANIKQYANPIRPTSSASSTSTTTRSDSTKPKMPVAPAWLGQNADGKKKECEKFVFEEPEQALRQPPKEKIIDKPGVYDISTEPSGISRIRFFPNFIEADECASMFDDLFHELPWRQRSDVKDNQMYLQPRLTAWFGDLPYSYSGVILQPNPNWSPVLQVIKHRLEEATGYMFNSMLANLYRDGHDHVSWHSDDESSLGPEPTIASLSFGDTRNFNLRKKPPKEEEGDYTYMEHVQLPLSDGSLLIMEGATQADWQHRVPREYHDRSARINLTFRVIYPT